MAAALHFIDANASIVNGGNAVLDSGGEEDPFFPIS
jgi:hypothetical protein